MFFPRIVGKAPINKATVVNPKDKPLLLGKTFTIASKVTGIVKLKINAPNIAKKGKVE